MDLNLLRSIIARIATGGKKAGEENGVRRSAKKTEEPD